MQAINYKTLDPGVKHRDDGLWFGDAGIEHRDDGIYVGSGVKHRGGGICVDSVSSTGMMAFFMNTTDDGFF